MAVGCVAGLRLGGIAAGVVAFVPVGLVAVDAYAFAGTIRCPVPVNTSPAIRHFDSHSTQSAGALAGLLATAATKRPKSLQPSASSTLSVPTDATSHR